MIYINSEGDAMAVDFSLEGAKWGSPELGTAGGTVTWAVDDSISQTELQTINAAFAEWSEVANIQFQQVASTAESDIDFANSALDGAGNVLGVTGFSYSGGQLQSADIKFDSGDNLSGSDFSLVAIHEIGHAIGLGHFNDDPAVMNSTANFDLTGLAQSDIDGVLALYGANPTDMSDAGTGITPPDTGDTGATPDTPTTPTAGADNGGAGGCGGTQTAAGDGATGTAIGTGADAGMGDGGAAHAFGGDLGGRFADLASLLHSIQGDRSDAAAAPGADLHSAQLAELSNVAHQFVDHHLWG
ncbi:matrixin family metalloprotease [Bradyrhizobium lablabi]|uniref:matrixin family metalloprotease n=1 Tax=Bradyrhizobium lablabi TaxID=722472 RepID=UPI0012E377BC|nr:matrixin family metalloprotease [Bradyrhizobium lablabi]